MDANRLKEIREKANATFLGMSNIIAQELLELVDEQQAEIERLNRANEVLEKAAFYYSEAERFEPRHNGGFSEMEGDAGALARAALEEAQRIKDGEQG